MLLRTHDAYEDFHIDEIMKTKMCADDKLMKMIMAMKMMTMMMLFLR